MCIRDRFNLARRIPGKEEFGETLRYFRHRLDATGVQLVTLGIIGEYLARMHFRVMRKPTYVIAEYVSRGESGTSR